MHITDRQVTTYLQAVSAALSSGRLNAWEQSFLTNMRSQLSGAGKQAELSQRQAAKLNEILAPYLSDMRASSAPQSTPSSNVTNIAEVRARFRSQKRQHSSRYRWLRSRQLGRLAVPLAFVIIALGAKFAADGFQQPRATSLGSTTELSRSDFSVTDGDTIQLRGERFGTRLVGFNTPETYRVHCARGLALGMKATQRLREMVTAAKKIELKKVACACAPGTQRCNFGRSCAYLYVDGRDVGPALISEGLAAPFHCGTTGCPPTPRPWCDG